MAYCRWSSDDYSCDIYCYESVYGGFRIQVAGCRYAFKEPLPEPVPFDKEHAAEWLARNNKIMEIVGRTELVSIGLPMDGEGMNVETAGEAAERLEDLRAIGYRVPQYAIDGLRREHAEEKQRFKT